MSTTQPSVMRAFLTAGPSTPTPLREWFPRPVITFRAFAERADELSRQHKTELPVMPTVGRPMLRQVFAYNRDGFHHGSTVQIDDLAIWVRCTANFRLDSR